MEVSDGEADAVGVEDWVSVEDIVGSVGLFNGLHIRYVCSCRLLDRRAEEG